jgi:Ni/Fe-hydrogenase subunit HybB-like protein
MTKLYLTDRIMLIDASGHPTRYNGKILVLFDQFFHGIYEGKVLSKLEFEMFEQVHKEVLLTQTTKVADLYLAIAVMAGLHHSSSDEKEM